MIKVVIDTNILVSALLTPDGIPARVLDLVLGGQLAICYDSRIVAEYDLVFSRPKFMFDKKKNRELIDIILERGISVVSAPSSIAMPDESDRKFYDVAKACDAILVTGNTKHFPDEPFIVTARQLISMLSE